MYGDFSPSSRREPQLPGAKVRSSTSPDSRQENLGRETSQRAANGNGPETSIWLCSSYQPRTEDHAAGAVRDPSASDEVTDPSQVFNQNSAKLAANREEIEQMLSGQTVEATGSARGKLLGALTTSSEEQPLGGLTLGNEGATSSS